MTWTFALLIASATLLAGYWAGRRSAPTLSPIDNLELLRRAVRELPFRVFLLDANADPLESPRHETADQPGAAEIASLQSVIADAIHRAASIEKFVEFRGRRWVMHVRPVPSSPPAGLVTFRDCSNDDSSIEDLAARNAAILQSSMDGFFIIGDDYQFIEVNAAYCRMVGYSAAELLKMKISDVEVPIDVRDRNARTNISRTGHHLFSAEHRHREGHVVELEISIITLRSGKRRRLVGFARNVTDRRRAERALAEREKQYRDLVETSHDLIWSVDREGRWTFVNRQAVLRIYGYEPEELLGRPFTDVLAPDRKGPDTRKFADILAGRPCYGYETVHVRKDGSYVTLLFNAIAMRDESGAVIGTTGTAADITDRKRAEEQLRQATDRFESVVRRMPLGYILWDTDFRAQAWNPAAEAIFGIPAADAIGQNGHHLIIPAGARDEIDAMWRSVIAGAVRDHAVFDLQRRDGERIRCEWSNAVIYDFNGAVSHVATLIRDVSERERLEAQLRRTQKMESLGVLAGGVAHDFNNALVGILCNTSLALEKLPVASEAHGYLTKVLNASRRSSELTRQMLVYAGKAAPEIRVIELNQVIRDMRELLESQLRRSVTFNVNLADNLARIDADAGQLQQVVMNLILNASEAIGEANGVVTISTYEKQVDARQIAAMYSDAQIAPGRFVCFEVSDTGCGMTPEVQARIFDPFFTTKFTGRGLGLAAILGIVRSHHGAIRVVSRPGVGTTFTVLLPTSAALRQDLPSTASTPPASLNGVTLLAVDDDPEVLDAVETVLTGRGCRVKSADSGPRALELFRQSPYAYDVVLLDMTMPGMSGEAVYDALCAIRPNVNVVFSSGYAEAPRVDTRTDARLRVRFIRKPFTIDQLSEAILSAAGDASSLPAD